MSMADNIKRLRTQHGMTQEELGKHLGVQKSAIRKYESGLVENIPRSSIQKMAVLFGVRPSVLMGFEEDVIGVPIGERIKFEREKNHLSQEDVAKAISSTKQAVYKYENGIVTNIPMEKVVIMADLFGVTPAYLMGWEEQKEASSSLYQKILLLDEEDQGKVDGFVSGLLSSSKYQSEEKTYQIQIAARGGGLKQITLTESQMAAILNAPEVTDLGGKS